jgi:hypothetical protein
MSNIEKLNTKLDISWQIRQNLIRLKREIQDQDRLKKIKSLKKFNKGFSLSGLTICPEYTPTQALELDNWYGYSVIKTKHSSELGWIIRRLSKYFKDIFYGMEGREYFYDLLLVNLEKDCKEEKHIKEIFKNLIINAELILTYYENDKVFSDDVWKHLRDKKALN